MKLLALLAVSFAFVGSVRANELPDEGSINCDHVQYGLRLAFDMNKKLVWGVRLNQDGKPETGLPYQLRIVPMFFVSAKTDGPNSFYNVTFKLHPKSSDLLASIFWAEGEGLLVNLYDLVLPEKPERTWTDMSCWTK
jgi:hypothetical protein